MKPKSIYGAYDGTEAHLPLMYGTAEDVARFLHRTVPSVITIAHRAEKNHKDDIVMRVGNMKDFGEDWNE